MEIITELREIPNLSIALGFFDGIHLGHRDVIEGAVRAAQYSNRQTAVVTFAEHPNVYLHNEKFRYILSHDDKYEIMASMGIDYLMELDFPKLRELTPEEFIADVLVKYYSPKVISAGFNYTFGLNKNGNVKTLSDYQKRYGYTFVGTPQRSVYGDKVSSSVIRKYISTGEVDMAEAMLGRPFSISGEVFKGKEVGRVIGYPTANIVYPSDVISVPYGAYSAIVTLEDGRVFRALVNYGVAPTVSEGVKELVEAHLLDFSGDLYGKNITIEFKRMIRPEIKFKNVYDLKAQLDLDLLAM